MSGVSKNASRSPQHTSRMTVIPNPRYSPFMPSLCRSSFADVKEDAADVPYDDVCVRVLMTSVGTRMRQAACGGIMHVDRAATQTEWNAPPRL